MTVTKKPVAKTLADFRKAHDKDTVVTTRIDQALEALRASGAEAWEYEGDFIKLAGISIADCSTYRSQYAEYVVDAPIVCQGGKSRNGTPRRVWFGDKKLAAKVRGE